jgi:hypothetical protein
MLRCDQFGNRPYVISNSRFHRWRHAQSLVYPAKVVVGEMQRAGRFQIVQLFRKRIRQSGKSTDCLSHRHVLSLHKTRRDMPHIGASVTYFYYCLYHRSRRIPSRRVVLSVITIQLYQLGKISLTGEYLFHSALVKVEAIRRDLEAVTFRDSVAKRSQELVCSLAIALPYRVGRNQFRFGVNRDKYPSITDLWRIFGLYVALFLRDEGPNFVALNMFTSKILHLCVHQCYATLSGQNQQAENCVAMQFCDALGAANARSFNQQLNCQQRFIFGNRHRAKQAGVFFRIRLAALRAAKPLKAVAVCSVFPAFQVAQRAIHGANIQQAVAVCQGRTKVQHRSGYDREPANPQTGGVI